MGGLVHATVSVDKSYVSRHSESKSSTMASISFKKFLSAKGAQVTGSTSTTTEFNQNSQLVARYAFTNIGTFTKDSWRPLILFFLETVATVGRRQPPAPMWTSPRGFPPSRTTPTSCLERVLSSQIKLEIKQLGLGWKLPFAGITVPKYRLHKHSKKGKFKNMDMVEILSG